MQKRFLPIFLCAVVALTGCTRAAPSGPLDLKFTAVDGREVDLAKLKGKVVLIDFWATWCAPCRAISPDLVEIYKKYHSQDLEIIGVSVDSDKQALLDFVKEEGEPWPVYFDGKGVDNVLANRFDIEQFPTLWLLDKKGNVVDPNFFDNWVSDGVIHPKTPDNIKQKIDAEIEKALKAS
jgi:thiol-disulfide isomerase/thioredoxin